MTLTVAGAVPNARRDIGRRRFGFGFDRLFIPSAIIDYTFLLLRIAGSGGDEKFLAWAGVGAGKDAVVTTVINPRAAAAKMHGEIPVEVVAGVFEALDARDLVLLAQLHTHPVGSGMSDVDRERPMFAMKGFFSIIVPDFGFGATNGVEAWGVYEYQATRRWRELDEIEKDRRVVIDDSIIKVD